MSAVHSTETNSRYELKSELARVCLPSNSRDPNRRLAWVNSLCLFFLLIGVVGAKNGVAIIHRPPPIEQAIPAIIEPTPPPPVKIEAQNTPEPADPDKPAPQVVVVVPDMPNINFSVPTIGTLLAPVGQAQAPPSEPLRPRVTRQNTVTTIAGTGSGGERPQPEYSQQAIELGEQGTVLLEMTAAANGTITEISVKQSSGYPLLDRSTLIFVKRHWILPAGVAGRVYQAPIRFLLAPP
jgi:protein TonB